VERTLPGGGARQVRPQSHYRKVILTNLAIENKSIVRYRPLAAGLLLMSGPAAHRNGRVSATSQRLVVSM